MTDMPLDIGPVEPAGPAAELARLMAASGVRPAGGILLCPIGEDCEWLVAPGHVPADVLAGAVYEHAKAEGWWPGERYTDDRRPDIDLPARTRHLLARVRVDAADWSIDWAHPQATVPVTVVDWE